MTAVEMLVSGLAAGVVTGLSLRGLALAVRTSERMGASGPK